ncbi:MAG: glutamate 5-kinase [Benniella sp.]|nr:MAG: glutamate 5-kinase [Benniella sp.]
MAKQQHHEKPRPKGLHSRKGSSKNLGDSLTIVIKLGTSSICDEVTHFPLLSTLSLIIETILKLKALGHRVVLVSSGAIGVGLRRMNLASKPKELAKIQAIAAVGQGRLMSLYDDLFGQFNQPIAQILLTKNDLADRTQYLNACNTLEALLEMDVVPIVNENDTISVSEIRFGDNDTLSAITAGMIHADYLFLMTDVDCLYTDNPRINPDAKPVLVVDDITALKEKVSVATAGSSLGTGGMITKLIAAELATAAGVTTVIARGSTPQRIFQIISQPIQHTRSASPKAEGKSDQAAASSLTEVSSTTTSALEETTMPLHTRFIAKDNPMVDRKWWILHGLHAAGTIYIDRGAYTAVTKASQKSSLFAAGIVGCQGTFVAQQSVRVVYRPRDFIKKDDQGQPIQGQEAEDTGEAEEIVVGKGLVNYASHEILRIMGCHSSQIIERLGYADAECVIHRENMTRTKLTES